MLMLTMLMYLLAFGSVYSQVGTTLTAFAGRWNAISGSLKDMSGGGVTMFLQNLQAGVDYYLDDFILTRCSVQDFRCRKALLR